MLDFIASTAIGYTLGSVNPAFELGKLAGKDIRSEGSGNAGASNALLVLGKSAGAFCAAFDILKGYFAVKLTEQLLPKYGRVFPASASAAVLGHIFPPRMGFKGGKGLACLGGVLLALDKKTFARVLVAESAVALATNYICFIPMTASAALPVIYAKKSNDPKGAAMLSVLPAVIIAKHMENLKRIKDGIELHISYLWKPQKELERIKKNFKERFRDKD